MTQPSLGNLIKRGIIGVLIMMAFIFFLFPIYWIVIASFKYKVDTFAPVALHVGMFQPTLDNYAAIFGLAERGDQASNPIQYPLHLLNSIIIAGGSTLLAITLGTMTAYAVSRFRVPLKNDLMFYILSQRMLPPVVIIIPVFLMFSALNLSNSYVGLGLLYTTFNIPFVVWMMKGFFDEIPKEYEEACMIDGYSRFQAFLRATLPQALPGIAATAVFCIITAWNEYVFAFILNNNNASTVPVFIARNSQGTAGINWGIIAAMSVVFVIPVFIFTFLVRNHLLRGVTFGAVRR